MIYSPKSFQILQEDPRIEKLIQAYPFATLIAFGGAGSQSQVPLVISHLPMVAHKTSESSFQLLGHMAKANPQWRSFTNEMEANQCLVIFHGPDTYITPKWYRSGRDVPTWNYAVVHVHGRLELRPKFTDQKQILAKLVEHFEKQEARPWQFDLPDDLEQPSALEEAIMSFVIHVDKIEAKFKLSQNRPNIDQDGIKEGLQNRQDEKSRQILQLMHGFENQKN